MQGKLKREGESKGASKKSTPYGSAHSIPRNRSRKTIGASDDQVYSEQSSFNLEDKEDEKRENKNETIERVLNRLGLEKPQEEQDNAQELEMLVGNIVENCVGTIDSESNLDYFEKMFGETYKEALKEKQKQCSLTVSEFNESEKIEMMGDEGFIAIIKEFRLFLKKISDTCTVIVEHNLFEALVLIVIILNSVKMAVDNPLTTDDDNQTIETIFLVFYTLEMGIKIIAFGFLFNKGAYLRDVWNILDFIIVVTSLLPYIVNFGFSVNALRAVRVLRPLKTITKVKPLKMIVSTLFYSFSLVMDSLYILFFVMLVFAIAGNQLFSGVLKNRCIEVETGTVTEDLCMQGSICSDGFVCGKGIDNPNFSIISFDTILWSLLSVFQTLTLEGWSEIMIDLQKTFSPVSAIFSILIVFFCEYVILNMTMAILKYKYSQVKGNTIEEEEEEQTEYEPDFLKKLGIFKDYTSISIEAPLNRYYSKDKVFVGAIEFNPEMNAEYIDYMQNNFESPHIPTLKSFGKIGIPKQRKFEVSKLQKNTKIDEYKWDVKALQFESVNFNGDEPLNVNPVTKSVKFFKVDSDDESNNSNSQDSAIEEEDSFTESDSEEEASLDSDKEQAKQKFINEKVLEMQRKLGQSKKLIPGENFDEPQRNSRYLSRVSAIPFDSSRVKQQIEANKESERVREMNEALGLVSSNINIESNPKIPNKINLSGIIIPKIDFESYKVDQFYERFHDLGDNRVKRLEKVNELNFFNIKQQKKFAKKDKKEEKNTIKILSEENSLDIKELQLVNELSKKKMKFRIKAKEELDDQEKYDKSRVLISQTEKEKQKKTDELEENIKNMKLVMKYKALPREIESPFDFGFGFLRNYESQFKGLRITEFRMRFEKEDLNKNSSYKSIGVKTVNYMKLLQNHKIEEKIEFEEGKIVNMFFKKEKESCIVKKEKQFEEEYREIKEGDIFNRHGNIKITCPAQIHGECEEEFIKSINIQDEEYEIYMKGLFGIFNVLRKKTLLFINKPIYENLMLLFVIANTLTLSLNGLVETDSGPLVQLNFVFTIVFAVDLGVKIFAYGFEFFTDIMNIFDSFVVSISIVEMTIGTVGANLSALRSIRILRAFRVLRITRLVRSLSYMKVVMSVVSSIITEFVYVLLLMLLFILIYTLLGMQLFGGGLPSQEVTGIRQNFDTFFNSFFSVFQLMTVENWNDIETAILESSSAYIGILYMISWIFIGNWILMSLIQAILLDGFDEDSSPQGIEEEESTAHSATVSDSESSDETKSTDETFANQFQNQDASLLLFYPTSFVRVIAGKIVFSKMFENVIIILIAISSVKLVVDTYLKEGTQIYEISDMLDNVLNSIFIFECVLKIIARGFILGENAYLKDNWSVLDFIIVITAIIDMASESLNLGILKLFRTLRPLRIISRNPDMKIIISSLAHSMCGIFNVLIIILCVFLMFGILAINLLQNKMNFCNVTGSDFVVNEYGPYGVDQATCESQGGSWATQVINYDNILNALLSLYVFSTRENWPFITYTMIDSNENVKICFIEGPSKDEGQILYMLFTVAIIFICSYFFMDLLVGVLFMNFHEAERKYRPKTLTDKQINWKNLQKIIVEEDPCFELYLEPENSIRKFVIISFIQFHGIVTKKIFEFVVTACIVGNIVVMMIDEDDQSLETTYILSQVNFGFSIFFMGEMVLKLFAFGKAYFYSGWNIFDFFVVMASILDIVLSHVGISGSSSAALSVLPQIARIFRVMRVTKILRMFKRFKGLQKLIETFLFSIPALGRGLSIVFLFLFITSVLASYLFSNVESDFSGNFSDYQNFKNFHLSIQTLFIMTTGENWYYYVYETILPGYVTCKAGTECVQMVYILFWLIYVFLSQKVFMELFVLIVLDEFESNYIKENNPLGIFALFEEDFRNNWIEVTTKYRSQKIETKRLLDLLLVLKQPLGLGKNELIGKYESELRENENLSEEEIQQRIKELDMKLKKNGAKLIQKMDIIQNRLYLSYQETFYRFAKVALMNDFLADATYEQTQMLEEIHKESEDKLIQLMPKGNNYEFEEGEIENIEPLNPIELILFSQMIMKSWHNYSLKFHSEKNNNIEKEDSLNNSCSSEIAEANLEKLPPMQKRISKRKGVLEGLKIREGVLEFKVMPDIDDHYQNDKKKRRGSKDLRKGISSITGSNSLRPRITICSNGKTEKTDE